MRIFYFHFRARRRRVRSVTLWPRGARSTFGVRDGRSTSGSIAPPALLVEVDRVGVDGQTAWLDRARCLAVGGELHVELVRTSGRSDEGDHAGDEPVQRVVGIVDEDAIAHLERVPMAPQHGRAPIGATADGVWMRCTDPPRRARRRRRASGGRRHNGRPAQARRLTRELPPYRRGRHWVGCRPRGRAQQVAERQNGRRPSPLVDGNGPDHDGGGGSNRPREQRRRS